MIQNAKIIAVNADADDYHVEKGARGSDKFVMSSSHLRLFDACPERWVKGYNPPDSAAKRYGNLIDTLLLTPELFDKRYVVEPSVYMNEDGEQKPWNNNAKVCRAWVAEQGGREIVKKAAMDAASEALKAIQGQLTADPVIVEFMDCCQKQVHVVGEWHDRNGVIVPIQCLIDLVPSGDSIYANCLGDLKTTRNGGLLAWNRWAFQAGYHIQGYWNIALLNAAAGQMRDTFCFILQENFEPYITAKRMLSQAALTFGGREVNRIMSNYCACLAAGKWPGYDDHDEALEGGWSLVNPDPWLEERAMFNPQFNFEAQETATEPTEETNDIIP